ncbi:TPA: hypothetical protein JBJ29_14365 [Legionella pneumophila]|nr:hypothetical protein [Legionella pneumophila]
MNDSICYDGLSRFYLETGEVMNTRGLKIFFLIGMLCLGYGLTACTKTTTSKEVHPESGYEGGFGGDGEHRHPNQ